MRASLLAGVLGSNSAEFVQSVPHNLEPVVLTTDNRIAEGQLRMTAGVLPFGEGPGIDRGGTTWEGEHYRAMGTKLVKVSPAGAVATLGDIGGSGPVTMDAGFGRLAIRSGTSLFYWDGAALTLVTDQDLGPVHDLLWIDGFYMTTDGTSVIVTEVSDPYQVLPLKYGSAEEDPDQVTGLIKVRNEAYVVGRYSIQVFRNIGGNGFPFQTLRGATIPYGCVSASAKCLYAETFAFVGSAKNGQGAADALGVYLAGQGTASKISTRVVDDALAAVVDPTMIACESRASRDEYRLLVHLPDVTWVFLANASKRAGEPVWYSAGSGRSSPYRPRWAVNAHGKVIVGDVGCAKLGVLTDDVSTHWGEDTEWRFDAGPVMGGPIGGIVHAVDLIGLPGRAPNGVNGTAFLSMSRDGQTFSIERGIPMGKAGDRGRRLQWRPGVSFGNMISFRFRGFSAAMPGFAACEVKVRPLGG